MYAVANVTVTMSAGPDAGAVPVVTVISPEISLPTITQVGDPVPAPDPSVWVGVPLFPTSWRRDKVPLNVPVVELTVVVVRPLNVGESVVRIS